MKKSVKIWLVTAASCVVLGTAIIGGIFAMAKGDITKFLTQKMETNEHKLSAEFSEITLITNTADVEIIPTDKDYAYVVCREMEKQKHTVKVNEGKLLIEVEDTRKWYDHIGVIFENSAISVYLPRKDYGDISVKADTGTVKISEAFKFKGIDVEVTTGDVKIAGVSAGRIDASATTGDVSLEKVSCSGELSVSVSTGSVSANNVTCKSFVTTGTTGDVNMSNVVAEEMLSLDVHTGSISFDGCDAAEIRMTTSTGDVKGSLLSGKIFTVKTETGSIDVPDSTGGSCKVTTTTGSIKIQIK